MRRGSTHLKSVFFSYCHKDEALRDQLETHLAMLKRQGVISMWHDRRLVAGDNVDAGIAIELDRADIILMLVSPDFLASDYCYGVEVARALERYAAGEARVIPVILRPCDWQAAPFGKLLAAPTDGRPVTKWPDPDDAFLDITKAIRAAAIPKGGVVPTPNAQRNIASAAPNVVRPRSSLEARNPGIEVAFKRIDANHFTASIYRGGENVARCKYGWAALEGTV